MKERKHRGIDPTICQGIRVGKAYTKIEFKQIRRM